MWGGVINYKRLYATMIERVDSALRFLEGEAAEEPNCWRAAEMLRSALAETEELYASMSAEALSGDHPSRGAKKS